MLGIDNPQIWLASILCIVSALGCMVYGPLKWNEEESEEW
ncbi:symporter small accessory protein [Methanococcoides burtonii]